MFFAYITMFGYGFILGVCACYIWADNYNKRQELQRQADLDTGTPIKAQLDREWEEWQ